MRVLFYWDGDLEPFTEAGGSPEEYETIPKVGETVLLCILDEQYATSYRQASVVERKPVLNLAVREPYSHETGPADPEKPRLTGSDNESVLCVGVFLRLLPKSE